MRYILVLLIVYMCSGCSKDNSILMKEVGDLKFDMMGVWENGAMWGFQAGRDGAFEGQEIDDVLPQLRRLKDLVMEDK